MQENATLRWQLLRELRGDQYSFRLFVAQTQMRRLLLAMLLLEFLVLSNTEQVNSQSRDIRAVTEQELNRDITETDEQRAQRRSKVTRKGAMQHYWNGNFRAALEDMLVLLAKDPADVDINFYIGACYLETNIDKLAAIPYLEYVVQQPKFNKEVIYQLGRAYMFANRFDEAIVTFNKYKDIQRGKDDNIITGSRMIEMCFNAKQLVRFPRDVKFENLGSLVNSPYPDYNPFIPENESFLVFTSKRPDCLGLQLDYDGYKTPDIFLSRAFRGQFREARNIGSSVNTEWYEEVVGVSPDGTELLVYIDNYDGYDDIYVSPRKGRFFDEYYSIGRNVNTDDIETTASMSSDGKILFFSREITGSGRGTDLYMSRKLPNGEWGVAALLPDVINTRYNESFPHLAADGRTFYFCSEGHSSMGGFDIFVSEYDDLTGLWSVPKNLGYPINTVDDDFNISMSTTGRYGYTAQFRPGEGFGERDIYRVTFFDVDPVYSIVRGSITNIRDSIAADKDYEVGNFEMTVTDMNTDQFIGVYKPSRRSSNYAQVLEPGEYCVYVQGEMFYDTSAVIEVLGKDAFVSEIVKDYTLRPDPDAIRRAKRKDGAGAIYAMSGSDDKSARLWDILSGKQVLRLDDNAAVTAVAFCQNGTQALTATVSGDLTVWSIPEGQTIKSFKAHRAAITRVAFTPDCRYILTASRDSAIRLWDGASGEEVQTYLGHKDKVNDFAFGPDGSYFVSVSDDSNALMWELMTGELVGAYDEHSGKVKGVDYASRGNYVVTTSTEKEVFVWDGSNAKRTRSFDMHASSVTKAKVSSDASTVVTGSSDGFLYSWNAKDATVKHALVGLDKGVNGLFLSADGKYVLASDGTKIPRAWSLQTGDEVNKYIGHTARVNDVCFTPFIVFPQEDERERELALLMRESEAIPESIDELEAEISRLEAELEQMERMRQLGYDPELLDVDIFKVKKLKAGQKIVLERIYFDFDKSDIREESVVELNKLLMFLSSNPNVVVEISGHTDSRGTDDYNQKLSMRRAKSVVAWLRTRGVPSKRLVSKGYGKTRHIAPNENPDGSDNPEGRQMNRRIELTILSVDGDKIITTEGK